MLSRLRAKRPGTSLGNLALYESINRVVAMAFRLIYRRRVYGAARIPRDGALLLVANHQSNLDPPAIGSSIHGRHIDYVARLGLFKSSRFFSGLISSLNALPIREDGGDAAAIKEVLRRLEAGRAVLIFPEGTRSSDGAMHEFKRGIAVLVKRAKCPVLPIAVEGCFDAWPRGRNLPRIRGARVAVAFGSAIPHDELMTGGGDAALARLASEVDHMRRALRAKLRRASDGRYPARGPGDAPGIAIQSTTLHAT